MHFQQYSCHWKHGFLPSLHCGFTAPDAVAYKGVGDSVQARKLVKLSRAPIVFDCQGIFVRCFSRLASGIFTVFNPNPSLYQGKLPASGISIEKTLQKILYSPKNALFWYFRSFKSISGKKDLKKIPFNDKTSIIQKYLFRVILSFVWWRIWVWKQRIFRTTAECKKW